MLGFVAAVSAELASGEGVLRQWSQEPTGIFMAFVLFMAASLVPLTRGAKEEAFGPFTPAAEKLNGRAAMVSYGASAGVALHCIAKEARLSCVAQLEREPTGFVVLVADWLRCSAHH